MDWMKLFGTVIAVFFHPGSTSKINGHRICRRGTERPCYRVSYIQDSRRRLTFEDAGQACVSDGGRLLSIESESEQRLIERFIQQLQAGDGDYWIGLRRGPQRHRAGTTSPGCPSQYYWLDGSKAKFRNWHWDEPSCGGEMCAVLYHQPSAPPDGEGHFLFQWNDDNCNSKNNFVCKYPEEKVPPVFSEEEKDEDAAPPLKPDLPSTTDRTDVGLTDSSVSISDDSPDLSHVLYATIPALLLLLFAAAGGFCYKQHAKRRKTEAQSYPGGSKASTPAAPYAVQGPYAFSDITKLPHIAAPADVGTKHPCPPSQYSQCDEYEEVSCAGRESGFVTNDIYETCRAQSRRCRSQPGWVENEIYG